MCVEIAAVAGPIRVHRWVKPSLPADYVVDTAIMMIGSGGSGRVSINLVGAKFWIPTIRFSGFDPISNYGTYARTKHEEEFCLRHRVK